MKLSKSLLSAIAIGVSVSAMSSCNVASLYENPNPAETKKSVTEDPETCPETPDWGDCPACGMG